MREKLTALLILLILSLHGFASPSLKPSIQDFTAGSPELSGEQIVKIALEYSLCPSDSQEFSQCVSRYKTLENAAQKKLSLLSQQEAAEKLLFFLYDGVLFKYVEHSTKLNTTLLTGEYNCVTASLLYLALSQSLGLDSRGQETTLHAFVTVYIDGNPVDVETTNPYGFNPGTKKTVSETENSRTYSVVPKKYYAGRREVSLRAFATLTGRNLAADMNETEDYDRAIPLDVSRWYFLAGDKEQATAKKELDVLVTNYALIQGKSGNTTEAVRFLTEYIEIFGSSSEVRKTFDNTVYNGCVTLLNDNKEDQAATFLFSNKDYMSQIMFDRTAKTITTQKNRRHEITVHNRIVPLFNDGNFQEALEILQEALVENPTSTVLKKDLQLVERALRQ